MGAAVFSSSYLDLLVTYFAKVNININTNKGRYTNPLTMPCTHTTYALSTVVRKF